MTKKITKNVNNEIFIYTATCISYTLLLIIVYCVCYENRVVFD